MTQPARTVALEALVAIEADGSYANLRLGPILERSGLDDRDRRLVTELVYGAIRQRRALDFLADRFLSSDPPPVPRNALRLGAYQLRYTDIPDHAAVSATVESVPKRYRGLVNAVLRKVATQPVTWPNESTRLSYPEWIMDRLTADLGADDAKAMAETMNKAPEVHTRSDGYIQDRSSLWVVDEVGAHGGDLVIDVCAAPGGKATAMASAGATVIAVDRRQSRVALMAGNASKYGAGSMACAVGDATAPPFHGAPADKVLVDAPCSGLGVLRRRADARWRLDADAPARLSLIQQRILASSADLVAPGGRLVYSACTVTEEETTGVASAFTAVDSRFEAEPLTGDVWREWGSGGLVLPQDHDSDAMAVFRWRRVR